jgi:hypothetical protein
MRLYMTSFVSLICEDMQTVTTGHWCLKKWHFKMHAVSSQSAYTWLGNYISRGRGGVHRILHKKKHSESTRILRR